MKVGERTGLGPRDDVGVPERLDDRRARYLAILICRTCNTWEKDDLRLPALVEGDLLNSTRTALNDSFKIFS